MSGIKQYWRSEVQTTRTGSAGSEMRRRRAGAEVRSSGRLSGRTELPKSALNIEDFATVRPAFG
jgi:hypothetical protein